MKRRLLSVRAVVCIAALGIAVAFVGFGRSMTTTAGAGKLVAISRHLAPLRPVLLDAEPARPSARSRLARPSRSPRRALDVQDFGAARTHDRHRVVLDVPRDTSQLTELAGSITRAQATVALYLQQGGSLRTLAALAGGQAESLAFQDVMIGFGAFVLLAIPLIFFADTRAGRVVSDVR